MIDIVDRLRFDATRREAQFSKGVASNIEEAVAEIERLRSAIVDSIEALERNSTSAPVVECLKAALALSSQQHSTGE